MRIFGFACMCVLISAVLGITTESRVSNTRVVSYPVWDHYTVPNGTMAFACVHSFGYESIEEYQVNQKLDPDGIVGATTWASIESQLAERGLVLSRESPLTMTVTEKQAGIGVILSNNTTRVISLVGSTAEFRVILHVRYSSTNSSGQSYLSSKDIPIVFSEGTGIPSLGTVASHVPLASLPVFDGAKMWAECVIVYSNRISHLRSTTTILGRRR